jgi:hypothetical protein
MHHPEEERGSGRGSHQIDGFIPDLLEPAHGWRRRVAAALLRRTSSTLVLRERTGSREATLPYTTHAALLFLSGRGGEEWWVGGDERG